MPPKKKTKSSTGVAAAPAASQPSPSPSPSPPAALLLTSDGIEKLRTLSQHRPQRLAIGGLKLRDMMMHTVASPSAALAPAADAAHVAPEPVTLQVVQINRYYVDHRFWSLVGVPFPTLPSTLPGMPTAAQRVGEQKDNGNSNRNGDRMEDIAASSGSGLGPHSLTNASPSFDAYSDIHVAYDLILSDGSNQLKVVLSPTLSIHIEKGGILPFSIIRVHEATRRFDETVVAGAGFYLIKAVDVLDRMEDVIYNDPSIPLAYPAWVNASDQLSKPLIGGPRSYYLSLFNEDTLFFDETNYSHQGEAERIDKEQKMMRLAPNLIARDAEMEETKDGGGPESRAIGRTIKPARKPGTAAAAHVPLVMQDARLEEPKVLLRKDCITINQLLQAGEGFQPGDKVIVCRVFAKSRIQTFGRKSAHSSSSSGKDLLRSPFNFDLLVGDESNEQIKIVLWNTLVGAYFHRVHIGQLIAIRGFRLKHARQDQQYELALNAYNPIGSIRVLEGEYTVEQSVGELIPPITMTVSSISIVRTMADESYFDTAGILTYVSPMLREWSQPKRQFYQYRWMLIVDQSCTDALAVKVYTNSQQLILESLRAGDVVYLSNLTLRSTNSPDTPHLTRSIVATSTSYTQILDQPMQEAMQYPYLQTLHAWRDTVDHLELAQYPSLYLWNLDFAQYKSLFGDTITPIRELASVADSLRYQQLRCILVQGFIAELIIHPAGLRPITDGIMDEEEYKKALDRMYPDMGFATAENVAPAEVRIEEMKQDGDTATADQQQLQSPPPKRRGRQSRTVTIAAAPTAASAASAAVDPASSTEMDLSQSSSISARLRRSTRAVTHVTEVSLSQESASSKRGRRSSTAVPMDTTEDEPVASAAAAPAERVTRSSRAQQERESSASGSRTRNTSRRGKKGGRGGRSKRAASADAAATTRTTGQKVTKLIRKRKASVSPSQPTPSDSASAAGIAPTPTPATPPTLPPKPAIHHPSLPSVLATLFIRDLNGENVHQVELHDPVLPHVNFEKALNTIAATCVTPNVAPRVFLGLASVLPSSSFTPAEWNSWLSSACSVDARTRKKRAALTAHEKIHVAIEHMHAAMQSALSTRRILAALNLTRTDYRAVETRITSIFQADK